MAPVHALPVMALAGVNWKNNINKLLIMIGTITGDEQIDNSHKVKQKSILEMFPEYGFKMAYEKLKKYKIFLAIYAIILVFGPAIIIFEASGFFSRFKRLYTSCPKIVYIQNTHWWTKYCCFIVNEYRKLGLIDSNLKILIQPQYDSIKWIKKNKLIEVNLCQESFLVDIKNNRYI